MEVVVGSASGGDGGDGDGGDGGSSNLGLRRTGY